jgi:hypothetical protein
LIGIGCPKNFIGCPLIGIRRLKNFKGDSLFGIGWAMNFIGCPMIGKGWVVNFIGHLLIGIGWAKNFIGYPMNFRSPPGYRGETGTQGHRLLLCWPGRIFAWHEYLLKRTFEKPDPDDADNETETPVG